MKKIIALLAALAVSVSAYAEAASEWAFSGIYAAIEFGIIDGVWSFSDYTRPITREEISKMAVKTYEGVTDEYVRVSYEDNPFEDTESRWPLAAVRLGFMNGRSENIFAGNETITRQECAKLFVDVAQKLELEPTGEAQYYNDNWAIAPWALEYVNLASAYGYLSADWQGNFLPEDKLTVEQAASIFERMFTAARPDIQVTGEGYGLVKKPSEYYVGTGDYIYNGRYKRNDRASVFTDGEITTKEEADAQMTKVTVNIWELRGEEKVASTMTLTVHKNIADVVKAVFDDIYNGSEKFPIDRYGTYCYSFRTTAAGNRLSEHATGTAIDINPNENYCVYSNGSTVGELYAPGENPYSIQKFGDCWTAFVSHGFTWGGDAWSNPHDYMHFSYLGT